MRTILISCFVAASVLATGCAVESEGGEGTDGVSEEALRTSVKPGTFRLYNDARHEVTPMCDLYTKLELTNDARGAKATFRSVLEGFCRIAVPNDLRTYRLEANGTQCGSKLYKATAYTAQGVIRLNITDHRSRTCKDLVPAKIITEETNLNARPRTTVRKYSLDTVAPEAATLEGTLHRTMGIGGENTGTSIRTETTLQELVLGETAGQFQDGKFARASGTYGTITGVETGERRVLNVTSLLVCPDAGTEFDCTPRANVRLSHFCAPENRSWVAAKCEGVTYTN